VTHVVLDEADTLLDDSFIDDTVGQVRVCKPEMSAAIESRTGVPEPPRKKARKSAQLIAVGATIRRESYEMMKRVLPDMQLVEDHSRPNNRPPSTIRQRWVNVKHPETKLATVMRLIRKHPSRQYLVFCNKSTACSFLAQSLQEHGIPAVSLHGGLMKQHRRENLKQFRKDGGVMVVTDVGARGLDFPEVGLVILYEPPPFASEYVPLATSSHLASLGVTPGIAPPLCLLSFFFFFFLQHPHQMSARHTLFDLDVSSLPPRRQQVPPPSWTDWESIERGACHHAGRPQGRKAGRHHPTSASR
jgi:hypothetical protein